MNNSGYKCPECGHELVWFSRLLGELVCEECSFSCNVSDLNESDDDYDEVWPEEDDDDCEDSGEDYDEVYGELDHARDDD